MAVDCPTYQVPDEYGEDKKRLDSHHFTITGNAVAGVLNSVTDPDVRAEIGAVMMAMSSALAGLADEYNRHRLQLAQRAYADGRRDGYEQLGVELGMITKPTDGQPPTMH